MKKSFHDMEELHEKRLEEDRCQREEGINILRKKRPLDISELLDERTKRTDEAKNWGGMEGKW